MRIGETKGILHARPLLRAVLFSAFAVGHLREDFLTFVLRFAIFSLLNKLFLSFSLTDFASDF